MSSVYKRGLIVWFAGVFYYLYQYTIRVSPGIMVDDLMLAFALDAESLGYLIATTTFFYALAQLPVGVVSDLLGARKIILYSVLLCTIGVAAMAWTQYLPIAFVGRALIGVGSAAGFICVSKISSEWFPVSQKALWLALTILMGTLGALLGYAPLAQLTEAIGWRDSLTYLVWLGCFVFVVNVLFLKDRAVTQGEFLDRAKIVGQIKEVLRNRFVWLYALTALGMYLPISVFADLWGVSFLTLKYGLSREVAAKVLSWSYVGTCGGVIFIALVSNILKQVRLLIGIASAAVTVLMAVIVFVPDLSNTTISVLLVLLGIFVGAEILCFSKVCQENDINVAATVTGFLNFVVTIGAAFVQQMVGGLIQWFWNGEVNSEGLPIYHVSDYQQALSLVIGISFSSFILAFFLQDKNPSFKRQDNAV